MIPPTDWPAPNSGEPPSGRRSVADVYSGSVLIELASAPVSAFQAANEARSMYGTCAAVVPARTPTDEKCDDAPLVYRSLWFEEKKL